MHSQLTLSIVIPAYNEEKRIGLTLERVVPYFKQVRKNSFEIIVVDDGSSDQTVRVVAKSLQETFYRLIENGRNRGKGYSVRQGMLAAQGQVILFTDADLSTPIEEFEKLAQALDGQYDVAIGSRSVPGSDIRVRQNFLRELMGKTFNFIARRLSFGEFHDSQCGFKAFTHDAAKAIFSKQKLDGFCFDAEILFLAERMGFQVKEVGVRWENSPQSKVRIVNDSIQMLMDLFRIRLLHWKEQF